MTCKLGDEALSLMVKKGQTVLADDLGRVLDQIPSPMKSRANEVCRQVDVAPRHGQDVVVDPAGNAFNVRVHLTQYLRMNQRIARLETMVTDLQGQLNMHQCLLHDLRREKFVTQGAFTAALLCKADQGILKSQRRKLDMVCKLLVSVGILEDGPGGSGLFVREQKETNLSSVQPPAAGCDSTTYTQECFARTQEEIARIEKLAMSATVEAQRAVAVAAEASEKSEKAVAHSTYVDEKCQQIDHKCQQVEKKCWDRLDHSLEENAERVETNSTRIFHLATEIEGLARSIRARKTAAEEEGEATSREEMRDVFSAELADLPSKYFHLEATALADAVPTERQAIDNAGCEYKSRNGKDPREVPGGVSVTKAQGDQHLRAPGWPGVLDEPSPGGLTNTEGSSDDAPTVLLVENLGHAPPPPHRRHSTYIERRVATPPARTEGRVSKLVVGPVRPPEDRPAARQATPSSWARASSWPLLTGEGTASAPAVRRLLDRKSCIDHIRHSDSAVGAGGLNLNGRGCSNPNLEQTRAHGELPISGMTSVKGGEKTLPTGVVPLGDPSSSSSNARDEGVIVSSHPHRHAEDIGNESTDDLCPEALRHGQRAARNDHPRERLSKPHEGSISCESRQPSPPTSQHLERMTATEAQPSPSQHLEGMTAKEAAEALLGASAPVVTRRSSRDFTSTNIDSLSATADPPGIRLACLVNTPELWCPQDTWNDGGGPQSSSDGSSTEVTVVGVREEDQSEQSQPRECQE